MRCFHSSHAARESRRVEVRQDLEAHVARERLRVLADEQVMVGVLHHRLGHERRRLTPSSAPTRARPLRRAVHARRVELHDAVGVRQPAVSDARVLGIELDDVDARDQRVEDVGAGHHLLEGGLDAGLRAAVPESMAVARRQSRRAGCCPAQ